MSMPTSVPTPQADSALIQWLADRRDDLSRRRWRGVLWIADDASNAVRKAMAWIASADWQSPLWIGPELPELPKSLARLSASRARSQLGSEHDLVVFDAVSAQSGFDPDAFGAISGTVLAGGWLVVLTPKHWQQPTGANWLPDADYQRLAHWPHEAETLSTHYLQRLAGRLRDNAELAVWPSDAALPLSSSAIVSGSEFEPDSHIDERLDDSDCLTQDQAEAVSRLTRMRRRRPVVLIADRGRGKSAALGIAAARRLMQGERRLWITASSVVAVETVFERLAQLLPSGRRDSNHFEVTLDGRDCCVEWLLPEQVTAALTAADIDAQSPPTLFVDEAAAIPAARLIAWLQQFPRIAFATTVHGYEGTGRGFEVRLRDALNRLTPDWKRLTLQTPIRWGVGDPLETLTRDQLCLDAEIASDESVSNAMREASVSYEWLDRESLARDEALLNPVFGLLVQAHYRTTPSDLRQLLDGPDVQLLAAFAGEAGEKRVVGLCVVQQEGGFDAELANAIYHGQRRPRGHLLAQSLATHGGFEAAALARWWRIMRIAVHPAVRRRGLGAAMIERIATTAGARGLDRLGVSFGAEPALIHFWGQQGFKTLRVGLTREASSGEPAQMMGRGLTFDAEQALACMNADHVCQLPGLLASELQDIEPLVVAAWLHEGAVPSLPHDLPERLAWFAAGGGELALVRPWLRLGWLAWWRQQPPTSVPQVLEVGRVDGFSDNGREHQDLTEAPHLAAAVAALFQYRDGALSARGRREQQGAARRLAATLLAWIAEKDGEQSGGKGGESASPPHMVKPQLDE
ncbi:tRNA(Met) cytidine acetyltransferase TmcA [Salinicola halophyticus]|uniref:tRNA(Met) cytidine acetyltransferase TmcA n=1 Tax=Salinicola halophyticus TaxID=1808881 RepID=UPI003F469A51